MAKWLVTGGSGSFGTALIRTVLSERPDISLVSISRNAEMRYRLEAQCATDRLAVLPGDVREIGDVRQALEYGPYDAIIHAAAEKHVGTGQRHRDYVRSINLTGTENVVYMAQWAGVPKVLMLSTDKSCLPINIYGQVKAAAERFCVGVSNDATRVSVVRYGNVVASSGSVIPLFIRQRQNGTLTVTDRRMSRYWMPLADPPYCETAIYQEPGGRPAMSAVRWVLLALEHMRGREIFVPEIPSAKVEEIARAIAPEAQIVETGIRDGEKLSEDLISDEEGRRCWRVPFGGWAILPSDYHVDRAHVDAGWEPELNGFCYRSDQEHQAVLVETR